MENELISATINGQSVKAQQGVTILEPARENGIEIPTLCCLENLTPVGACRICVVEVEGSRTLVGSCHTPVTEGMVIQTHSPKVLEARRVLIELMLASHPGSCLVCEAANCCELRRIAADLDIGLCDGAPAMLINDDPHVALTPEKISHLLRNYKYGVPGRRVLREMYALPPGHRGYVIDIGQVFPRRGLS